MILKRSCKETALALLARRDYATKELINKLKYKGYLADCINKTIDELIQIGYIQDERYTIYLIEAYQRKGIGPNRIVIELTKRGISDELITKHLNHADPKWQTTAYTTWLKRFKGQKPNHLLQRIKQMRFLQYRGFTQEQIHTLIDDFPL